METDRIDMEKDKKNTEMVDVGDMESFGEGNRAVGAVVVEEAGDLDRQDSGVDLVVIRREDMRVELNADMDDEVEGDVAVGCRSKNDLGKSTEVGLGSTYGGLGLVGKGIEGNTEKVAEEETKNLVDNRVVGVGMEMKWEVGRGTAKGSCSC